MYSSRGKNERFAYVSSLRVEGKSVLCQTKNTGDVGTELCIWGTMIIVLAICAYWSSDPLVYCFNDRGMHCTQNGRSFLTKRSLFSTSSRLVYLRLEKC